jgi:hypothetical protein
VSRQQRQIRVWNDRLSDIFTRYPTYTPPERILATPDSPPDSKVNDIKFNWKEDDHDLTLSLPRQLSGL